MYLPSTCVTAFLGNSRHTWKIPSTADMFDKNSFPSPAPSDAPLTRPAISVIPSTVIIMIIIMHRMRCCYPLQWYK